MSSPHIADLPEGGYRHEHVNKSLGDNMKSCSFWVNVYAHGVGGQTYPTRERARETAGVSGVTVGINLHRLDEADDKPVEVRVPFKAPTKGPISWDEAVQRSGINPISNNHVPPSDQRSTADLGPIQSQLGNQQPYAQRLPGGSAGPGRPHPIDPPEVFGTSEAYPGRLPIPEGEQKPRLRGTGQRSEDVAAMARHPPGNPIVGAVGMGQAIGRDWARQEASREQFESANLKLREAAAAQRKAVLREFLEPVLERMRHPPRTHPLGPLAYEFVGAELALVTAALEAYLDLPVKP